MVDPGKEFMGNVTKLMEKHRVTIQRSSAGNHRAQAFVERANRTIGKKLFRHQYAQEMISDDRSRVWVKRLPDIITGKEPNKAIKLEEFEIKSKKYEIPVGINEVRLPPGVIVRYLYAPGEDEGGERRRATDPIWSIEIYYISRTVVKLNQPVLYYLGDGPRRGFVREELRVVPEDTQLDALGSVHLGYT